jgi:hypothetical protein
MFVGIDPNFKIYDSFTINFQLQTFAHDGLVLWISDPLPESSFTIEIQNRQVKFLENLHFFYFSINIYSL